MLAVLLGVLAAACGGGDGGSPAEEKPAAQPSAAAEDEPTETVEVPDRCPSYGSGQEVWVNAGRFGPPKGKAPDPGTFCLTGPADESFELTLNNVKTKGAIALDHNISVYEDAYGLDAVFHGDYISPGKSTSYEIPALSAGAYLFRCDAHGRDMWGALVVD